MQAVLALLAVLIHPICTYHYAGHLLYTVALSKCISVLWEVYHPKGLETAAGPSSTPNSQISHPRLFLTFLISGGISDQDSRARNLMHLLCICHACITAFANSFLFLAGEPRHTNGTPFICDCMRHWSKRSYRATIYSNKMFASDQHLAITTI